MVREPAPHVNTEQVYLAGVGLRESSVVQLPVE
jgi:hypothetical protein